MGLDGETKMSKSRNNEIGLFEEADETMKKLRSAKTDPARVRREDKGHPEVCNVFSLHGFYTDDATRAQIDTDCRSAAIGCVDCKRILATNLELVNGPIREKAKEFRAHPDEVDAILAAGAQRASASARATLDVVAEKTGIHC
jgi:tryptophanyl-tRNA synthetase